MERLSSLGVLCYFCISHLVILQVLSDSADDLAGVCNTATSVTKCANLGNLSYPFGSSEPCAASESFLISNCSSDQAHWYGFEEAIVGGDEVLGAPVLTSFLRTGYSTYINLTWNMDMMSTTACDPPTAARVDTFVPYDINLTTFANGPFQFSFYNYYLLLNCSNSTMADVLVESPICQAYKNQCSGMESMPCAQLDVTQELQLHKALDNLSCSHFQSLTTSNNTSFKVSQWSTGMIQLLYLDGAQCQACVDSGGLCLSNTTSGSFKQCTCGDKSSHIDCNHISGCNHFLCKTAAKIAIGVATTTVASFVLFVLCCTRLCTRKYSLLQKMPKIVTKRSITPQVLRSSSHSFSHLNLDGLTERPIEYTYGSIVSATNSFCNLLGEGGFGAVYKGTLTHANDDLCIQIAVKVLEVRISNHHKKQFLNEVATIGRIHHVHVVRLLGICIEENHEMLVYEYVINGSLDKWLFNKNQVLHWEQRYAIAVGIAKGLGYLHEECRHRIVHCDIKPQNILLDAKMCPKIADFGLARLMGRDESRVATVAKGTPGYMAPEFWMGGESQVSTKFDVYSYGMVLLELMSGHRNFRDGVHFPEMAFEAAMRGDFESITDVKLGITKPSDDHSRTSDAMQWQQVRTAVLVALWCIQDHPMNRPSMSEVVQYLEGIAAINEQPPRPAITSALSVSAQQHPYFSNHHHYDVTPISGGR